MPYQLTTNFQHLGSFQIISLIARLDSLSRKRDHTYTGHVHIQVKSSLYMLCVFDRTCVTCRWDRCATWLKTKKTSGNFWEHCWKYLFNVDVRDRSHIKNTQGFLHSYLKVSIELYILTLECPSLRICCIQVSHAIHFVFISL